MTKFFLFAFILMLLILSRVFIIFYTAMQYVKVMGQASFADNDAFRLIVISIYMAFDNCISYVAYSFELFCTKKIR